MIYENKRTLIDLDFSAKFISSKQIHNFILVYILSIIIAVSEPIYLSSQYILIMFLSNILFNIKRK